MSDEDRDAPRRFTRIPRAAEHPSAAKISRDKFADSLDAIEAFLHHATIGGRDAFASNSPAYASGSMAIIRTAALFEIDEFEPFLRDVPDEVARGIVATRNIASHSGYRSMNDDLFWETLTTHLPPYVASWRAATGDETARD